MSIRMNADDQIRYLLICVKWSNYGRVRYAQRLIDSANSVVQVDFQEVADECGVVSKGAA